MKWFCLFEFTSKSTLQNVSKLQFLISDATERTFSGIFQQQGVCVIIHRVVYIG